MTSEPRAPEAGEAAPSLGDWLAEAFALFGKEWAVWLGQGTLCLLLIGPILAGFMVYCFAVLYREWSAALTGYGTDPLAGVRAIWQAIGVTALGFVPAGLISAYLIAGMMRTAARQLEGQPIRTRDLFSAGDVYLPSLAAALVTSLTVGLSLLFALVPALIVGTGGELGTALLWGAGLLLLVPPGLVLTGRLLLVHPLVSESRLGLLRACAASWRITGRHPVLYLVWTLLVYLVAGAGVIVAVGTAVTLPLGVLMLMVAYQHSALRG